MRDVFKKVGTIREKHPENCDRYFRARIKTIEEKQHLYIEFLQKRSIGWEIVGKHIICGNEWRSLFYIDGEWKKTKGMLCNSYHVGFPIASWARVNDVPYCSATTFKRIRSFTKEDFTIPLMGVVRYEYQAMNNRHYLKERVRLDEIGDIMDEYFDNGYPEDFYKFEKEKVFADCDFMVYDRKKQTCMCTHCKKNMQLDRVGRILYRRKPMEHILRQHMLTECPRCKRKVESIPSGFFKEENRFIRWSVLLERKNEDVVTIRYVRHIMDYNHGRKTYKTKEVLRSICYKDGTDMYMYSHEKYGFDYAWQDYVEPRHGMFNCGGPNEWDVSKNAVLYNEKLDEVTKDTWLKYSCLDKVYEKIIKKRVFDGFDMERYINLYRLYPFVELLVKTEFYHLIDMLLHSYCHDNGKGGIAISDAELHKGNNIYKVLGLDKIRYRYLRKNAENTTPDELSILQENGNVSEEEFEILKNFSMRDRKYVMPRVLEFMSLKKLYSYVVKAGVRHLEDYRDYLDMTEACGYNMKNKHNLFPSDFVEAHDRRIIEHKEMKEEIKRKEKERFNKQLEDLAKDLEHCPMFMVSGNLMIRPIKEIDELKVEGEELHHCVATYRDRVMKGETMILVIRKKENPDKPYYTMEWKGDVVQCRGMNNCNMTKEVEKFVDKFKDKMDREYGKTA